MNRGKLRLFKGIHFGQYRAKTSFSVGVDGGVL